MKSIFDEEDEEYVNNMNNSSCHDVAQICLNGHVVNSASRNSPKFNQKFCEQCGEPTITKCQKCNQSIPGEYHTPGIVVVHITRISTPSFCIHCGKAYPWTQLKLQAARDLLFEDEMLDVEEKALIADSLEDLVKDNSKTPVAISRYKKLVTRAGNETGTILKGLLVDIVSASVKKMIWPG